MGNRAEEDYNFVFKGESGVHKERGTPERPRKRTTEPAGSFLFLNQSAGPPPRAHHSFRSERKLKEWGRVCLPEQKSWNCQNALGKSIMLITP